MTGLNGIITPRKIFMWTRMALKMVDGARSGVGTITLKTLVRRIGVVGIQASATTDIPKVYV